MIVTRIARFVTTVARHGVPLGGIVARDWHPVTALGVYWLESVLMAISASLLCALMQRRTSHGAIDQARALGDMVTVRALELQREEVRTAGINPRDVLTFHLLSMFVFGGFLGGVLVILAGKERFDEPIRWQELALGAEAMLVVVAMYLTIDLRTFRRFSVARVQARVDACNTRWALFWLLGFFGTMTMVFMDRPSVFFGFFAVLKTTFESWAGLARLFGWRSLKDRAASRDTGSPR